MFSPVFTRKPAKQSQKAHRTKRSHSNERDEFVEDTDGPPRRKSACHRYVKDEYWRLLPEQQQSQGQIPFFLQSPPLPQLQSNTAQQSEMGPQSHPASQQHASQQVQALQYFSGQDSQMNQGPSSGLVQHVSTFNQMPTAEMSTFYQQTVPYAPIDHHFQESYPRTNAPPPIPYHMGTNDGSNGDLNVPQLLPQETSLQTSAMLHHLPARFPNLFHLTDAPRHSDDDIPKVSGPLGDATASAEANIQGSRMYPRMCRYQRAYFDMEAHTPIESWQYYRNPEDLDGNYWSEPQPSIDGYISQKHFKKIVKEYYDSLSPRKRAKALVSYDMYKHIITSLLTPKDTENRNAQSRHWARKSFFLGKSDRRLIYPDLVSEGRTTTGRPVAVRERLYNIITEAHAACHHGGRDKTAGNVNQHWSWVPKDLVARYVRQCPTCNDKRGPGRHRADAGRGSRRATVAEAAMQAEAQQYPRQGVSYPHPRDGQISHLPRSSIQPSPPASQSPPSNYMPNAYPILSNRHLVLDQRSGHHFPLSPASSRPASSSQPTPETHPSFYTRALSASQLSHLFGTGVFGSNVQDTHSATMLSPMEPIDSVTHPLIGGPNSYALDVSQPPVDDGLLSAFEGLGRPKPGSFSAPSMQQQSWVGYNIYNPDQQGSIP